MTKGTVERLAPLTGLVFAGLFAAVIFGLAHNEPGVKASAEKVVSYWSHHDDRELLANGLGAIAVAALVWFAGSLRVQLRAAEGGEGRLSAIAFAGFLLMAAGGLIVCGLGFTAADTVGDVPATVTQTLAVLRNEMFLPMAGGVTVAFVATGISAFRTGALPSWMAGVAFVIGVCALTPAGPAAFVASLAWIAVASLVLYQEAPH